MLGADLGIHIDKAALPAFDIAEAAVKAMQTIHALKQQVILIAAA